jgi:excisionase family DNA binding protein
MQKLLNVREAAEFLSLRPSTVRKMILQRRLPVVRIGRSVRIKEIDLEGIVRDGYRRPLEV